MSKIKVMGLFNKLLLYVVLLFLTLFLLSELYSQSVVADGSTVTGVSVGAGGKVKVSVAAPNRSGTSKNNYSVFNVPKAGLDLDNLQFGARTILNQVTGSTSSFINGQLEVLGTKAHVIIANPNGLRIDGGHFINVGGLALTTGRVSSRFYDVTPNFTQENTVVTTEGGEIRIEGAGLSGAFTYLELLAKKIFVDGAVINENDNALSHLRMTVGDSVAEFDSLLTPNSLTEQWVNIVGGNKTSQDEILLDITKNGSLNAAKIQVAVTDQGAGVRHAGTALARAGSFTLTANGEISINGGSISASENIIIQKPISQNSAEESGQSLTFNGSSGADGTKFNLDAGGGIEIRADAVRAVGGTMTTSLGDVNFGRVGIDALGESYFEVVSMQAGANINVYAENNLASVLASDMTAGTDINIISSSFLGSNIGEERFSLGAGNAVNILSDAVRAVGGSVTASAGDVNFGRAGVDALGESYFEDMTVQAGANINVYAENNKASVLASDMTAGADININSSNFLGSNIGEERFSLGAGNAVNVLADSVRAVGGSIASSDGDINFGKAGIVALGESYFEDMAVSSGNDININSEGTYVSAIESTMTAAQDINIKGSGLLARAVRDKDIEGNVIWKRTDANAGGGLFINVGAEGVRNEGSILQGTVAIANNSLSRGGLTILTEGDVINESLDELALGVISSNEGDLVMDIGGELKNYSARLLSASDINLEIAGDFTNETALNGDLDFKKIERKETKRKWYHFWKEDKSSYKISFNELKFGNQLAFVTAEGSINLDAKNAYNLAGEINANDGNVFIKSDILKNQGVRTGSAFIEKKRSWFIKKDVRGSADVQSFGGQISASDRVNVEAKTVENNGNIFAINDVFVKAKKISGGGSETYQYYDGPQGLRELWQGNRRKFLVSSAGASFVSEEGNVILRSDGEIVLRGGNVQAGKRIIVPNSYKIDNSKIDRKAFGDEPFGFLGRWLNW